MFEPDKYIPALKWKQGEYQALFRLTDEQKDGVVPLFEVPPVGYDFEAGENRESLDSHLADFGRRLHSKWASRLCLVDLKHIPVNEEMADGYHYVETVFEDLRLNKVRAIPVVSLRSDDQFLDCVADVAAQDGRGACLRLSVSDFDDDAFDDKIASVLSRIGLRKPSIDLVMDVEHRNFEPVKVVANTVLGMMDIVPGILRWRTLTLLGTSYPESVAKLPDEMVLRQEWRLYRHLLTRLGEQRRVPAFGDYGVAHPDLVELDMRLVKPFAKLRYTTESHWYIDRGTTVRTDGFGQYKKMCKKLIKQPFFDGPDFSAGDRYIFDCAAGEAPTGNLTTWVWVSTNRHLAKAVEGLASLHGT